MLDKVVALARHRPIVFVIWLVGIVIVFYAFTIVRYMMAGLPGLEQRHNNLVKAHLEATGFKAQAKSLKVHDGYGLGCSLLTLEPDRYDCYRFFVDEQFIQSGAITPMIFALVNPCGTEITRTDKNLHATFKCDSPSRITGTKKIEIVVTRNRKPLYIINLKI